MRVLGLIWCCAIAFAGQSITLSTSIVSNPNVAAQPATGACRVEVSFHDWDSNPPPNSHPWAAPACGFDFTLYNLGGGIFYLQIYSTHTGAPGCMVQLGVDANGNSILPSKFATVRFQRAPNADQSGFAELCEATDINGRTFHSDSHTYIGPFAAPSPGASAGGGIGVSTAYFRLFTTTVPFGSRPPVTADVGDLLEWKFDGNLNDSSIHGNTGTISGGVPVYVPTPGQNLVVPILQTANAPPWSSWISMRAGYPNQLDCSQSYSQADASPNVACSWGLASGPAGLAWSDQTSRQPTLNNVQFGGYTFSLQVTDAAGVTGTTTMQVGAVAYDDSGVVIPSDPNVTKIFGPMIAFGQNPWGYADERAKRAVELQNRYYATSWSPTWLTVGAGTVSYRFAGIGPVPGQPGTTLSSPISASATSINVADASMLPGLASLPTWILIGNTIGSQEMVRIAATTATQGPATLTVAYDGRGLANNSAGTAGVVSAQTWAAGTIVGEMRIQGANTLFASDPARPLCPAGLPGPPGPVVYSDGTVILVPSSNTITGVNTLWIDSHGATNPSAIFVTDKTGAASSTYFIRIEATHGGGLPFVWWALVTNVAGPTSISTSRSLPADVDPGPFAYKITGVRYFSLEFQAPDGTTQRALQNGLGCESETAAFAVATHDIPLLDPTTQDGVHYSYKESLGAQSAFGPNFYGSGLASRAFYLRSGWDFANTTANMMDDYWVRDPEICGGWCGGIPLLQGGGVIGAFANLVLNPATKLAWSDLRNFAARGAIGSAGCNAYDSRDSGYLEGWLVLAALFDPDQTQRSQWSAALQSVYDREANCKQLDNSWANSSLFNTTGPQLIVTNGSSAVTGSGLPSSICYGIASGTVTVTNGSANFTGTGLVNGNKITITGTLGGALYNGTFQFTQAGGSLGTLAALWPGDSGTFPFVIENNDWVTTIGTDDGDPQLKRNWACTWNNPSQITLHRPWDGPTESNARLFSYVLAGFGQQPFLLGIKTTAMTWAAQLDDATLAARFSALTALAGAWIHDVGYDPNTQGLNYGRVFEVCEPQTTATPNTAFGTRTPNCNQGLDPASLRAARVLSVEASQALNAYYLSAPSNDRRSWGDLVYGSVWGYCPYTTPGFYCDGNYVRDENSDLWLGAYKWPGYFFGMGMAHQWPAVRLR